MSTVEANFDGLVGPTHHYAGLSHGNVASMTHRGRVSNPREAALQGLAKMKFLAELGLPQGILPPHERPSVTTLRELGFAGSDAAVVEAAAKKAPRLLSACSSASAMWVANAATVTPSADTPDRRVHITPANLAAKFHRAIEPPQTRRILEAIFGDARHFVVHAPLPGGLGDEGAANHTRFAAPDGGPGLHLFAYGREGLGSPSADGRFPARQAREASEAVARQHGLSDGQTLFAAQAPAAIAAGVFHNDVISVGHEQVFIYHEQAFRGTPRVVAELRRRFDRMKSSLKFHAIRVSARRVALRDAVRSYLFNSQLVTVAPGRMALLAPADCLRVASVRRFLAELVEAGNTPIRDIHFLDLRQSMHNGGGPACLRLRVVLSEAERAAVAPGVWLTTGRYDQLTAWVRKHYRDRLTSSDLGDPRLLEESRRALDELTGLLGLGSLYPFQRG